jgi:hypothetical protein
MAYKTWSLTVREGYILRVSDDTSCEESVFGPEKNEMKVGLRKLRNVEFNKLHSS